MGHTDMKKAMQGLALLVRQQLHRDPHGGDLFVLRGRLGWPVKIADRLGALTARYAARPFGPDMDAIEDLAKEMAPESGCLSILAIVQRRLIRSKIDLVALREAPLSQKRAEAGDVAWGPPLLWR